MTLKILVGYNSFQELDSSHKIITFEVWKNAVAPSALGMKYIGLWRRRILLIVLNPVLTPTNLQAICSYCMLQPNPPAPLGNGTLWTQSAIR